MLTGRIAIVTGAASGIGLASARLFASHGAEVLAVDRDEAALRSAFADDPDILTLAKDVTDNDAPDAIVGTAMQTWGGVDILFNNAGVGARVPGESGYRSILDMPEDHWRRVLEINLTAQFRLTKSAIPALRRSLAGRVIVTGSPLAYRTSAGISVYNASKAGVAALTRAVAMEEGGNGITANWLEPGAIFTGMTRHSYTDEENRASWEAKSPLGRLGEPIDVACAALFLASDLSAFVTGHGLCVDGGITLGL